MEKMEIPASTKRRASSPLVETTSPKCRPPPSESAPLQTGKSVIVNMKPWLPVIVRLTTINGKKIAAFKASEIVVHFLNVVSFRNGLLYHWRKSGRVLPRGFWIEIFKKILPDAFESCMSGKIGDVIKTLDRSLQKAVDVNSFSLPPLKLCLLYTSPSPRDGLLSRMPSSA